MKDDSRIEQERLSATKCNMPRNVRLTVPSQVGQSLDGNGVLRSIEDGRCTSSARLSAIASATHSAVAFSPLQEIQREYSRLNNKTTIIELD